MTDFMKSRGMEEDMAESRHLWRLGVDIYIQQGVITGIKMLVEHTQAMPCSKSRRPCPFRDV